MELGICSRVLPSMEEQAGISSNKTQSSSSLPTFVFLEKSPITDVTAPGVPAGLTLQGCGFALPNNPWESPCDGSIPSPVSSFPSVQGSQVLSPHTDLVLLPWLGDFWGWQGDSTGVTAQWGQEHPAGNCLISWAWGL